MTDPEQAKLLVRALEEDPHLEVAAHEDYFDAESYRKSESTFLG